jgi:hypothetical protein
MDARRDSICRRGRYCVRNPTVALSSKAARLSDASWRITKPASAGVVLELRLVAAVAIVAGDLLDGVVPDQDGLAERCWWQPLPDGCFVEDVRQQCHQDGASPLIVCPPNEFKPFSFDLAQVRQSETAFRYRRHRVQMQPDGDGMLDVTCPGADLE